MADVEDFSVSDTHSSDILTAEDSIWPVLQPIADTPTHPQDPPRASDIMQWTPEASPELHQHLEFNDTCVSVSPGPQMFVYHAAVCVCMSAPAACVSWPEAAPISADDYNLAALAQDIDLSAPPDSGVTLEVEAAEALNQSAEKEAGSMESSGSVTPPLPAQPVDPTFSTV